MRKTLAVPATVAAVGATAMTVPAPAEARGLGPGLAFGLAAGALTAGAIAASHPYLRLCGAPTAIPTGRALLRPGPVRL